MPRSYPNQRFAHEFELFDRDHIDRLLRDPNVKQVAYVIDHAEDVVANGFVLCHHRVRTSSLRGRHPGVVFTMAEPLRWSQLIAKLGSRWPVRVKVRNPPA